MKEKPRRAFMDGIDWQHHLGVGNDPKGAVLFPSRKHTIAGKRCLSKGGRCGIVEVEVRLIRWVVDQRLDLEIKKRKRQSAADRSEK